MKNLIVIPGHGAGDSGAIAYDGTHESELTYALAECIKQACFNQLMHVVSTPMHHIPYLQRATFMRDAKKTISHALEVHFDFNAPKSSGTRVVLHSSASNTRRQYADMLGRAVAELIGIPYLGIMHTHDTHTGGVETIDNTPQKCMLLEVCFLNENNLNAYRATGAYAVAEVIANVMSKWIAND